MVCSAAQLAINSGWSIHSPNLVANDPRFGHWKDSCLGSLSPEALRELESIISVEEYETGTVLFLEQEQLTRIFIVLSVDVKLSMQDAGGRRLTFHIARLGSVLGMDSVLYESPTEWSAETIYPSRIGKIGREQFHRFAKGHPEIYRIASKELIATLQKTCSTLRIVGLSSCARRRLASQLLVWGESGCQSGDQTQFHMALSHAQIAEFIGTVRETVTRGLIVFKQSGLVEIRGSMLRIPSTAALRKYAAGECELPKIAPCPNYAGRRILD